MIRVKYQEDGQNKIMKNLIYFATHQILLWYSDDEKGAMYSKEMTNAFNNLVGKQKNRRTQRLGLYERTILNSELFTSIIVKIEIV
jgi:hypothetical protein